MTHKAAPLAGALGEVCSWKWPHTSTAADVLGGSESDPMRFSLSECPRTAIRRRWLRLPLNASTGRARLGEPTGASGTSFGRSASNTSQIVSPFSSEW
jgi:hypothetical protein